MAANYYVVTGDPRVVGLVCAPGSLVQDASTGLFYLKSGAGITAFTPATEAYGGSGGGPSEVPAHEAAADPHPGYALETDPRLTDARAPLTHSHGQADVTGLVSDLAGKAAAAHFHVVADTTGLQAALDGKAPSSHTQAISTVTGLQTALDGKAASSHTHVQADVTNLVSDLAAKQATSGKGVANGYAGLGAAAVVPAVQLGSGAASSTTFLRGDATWATPATGGGGTEKDDQYYRQVGATLDRWYVGGMANASALTTGAPTIGVLRAFSFFSVRGGTLDRIGVQVTTAVASAVGRVGIYTATSDTDLRPLTLVSGSDVAQLSLATVGMKFNTINVVLAANTLYWLALLCGTAASTLRCLSLAGCAGVFGVDNALGAAPGVGWSASQAFGALVSPFPTASAAVLAAVPVPAIAVRYSA